MIVKGERLKQAILLALADTELHLQVDGIMGHFVQSVITQSTVWSTQKLHTDGENVTPNISHIIKKIGERLIQIITLPVQLISDSPEHG
jgi:hypothetical protein